MPIYEYRCLDCQREYEKREGFDAPALQQCPNCDGTARRVLQAAPIVFKGSGFYVTDSRKSTPAAEAEAERTAESKTKSDGDSSSKDSSATEPAAAN